MNKKSHVVVITCCEDCTFFDCWAVPGDRRSTLYSARCHHPAASHFEYRGTDAHHVKFGRITDESMKTRVAVNCPLKLGNLVYKFKNIDKNKCLCNNEVMMKRNH